MNVQTTHLFPEPHQGLRPSDRRETSPSDREAPRPGSFAGGAGIPGSAGGGTPSRSSVLAEIDRLQQRVEGDLNIVRDPPFFPIATYQRTDLIKRVRIIEEAVQRLGLDRDVTTLSSGKLEDEASDREIAATLDKLFTFRDRQKSGDQAASKPPAEIGPGAILAVEV
jgi:hypothetical protein